MQLFIDVDSDTRLARQVIRDTSSRYAHSLSRILTSYLTHVKPSHEAYILPSKKHADVIIPRGIDNKVAIDLVVDHIWEVLNGRESRAELSYASEGRRWVMEEGLLGQGPEEDLFGSLIN